MKYPALTDCKVCKLVYKYFLLLGILNKLCSDRDIVYEAKLFQGLINQLGIKKLRTSGYNANVNNFYYKSNVVVKMLLVKYVNFGG